MSTQECKLETPCPVNSFNEWDPLEEVIVGRLEGATIPPSHISVTGGIPAGARRMLQLVAGRRYPRFMVKAAQRELGEFIHILETEGVKVRRPEIMDFSDRCKAPFWQSPGYCVACPRDGALIIGDEIIQTPMSWRSRYFEMHAYYSLFEEYFAQGARWTSAPRPRLLDSLYDQNFQVPRYGEPLRYVINESEVVFDAADFVRCGRDIFVHKSNVTNAKGISWLRRHLGERYNVHEIESRCPNPMHIDSSFVPLAPGKVLVNPEYIDVARLPPILKSWDIIIAPDPDPLEASGALESLVLKYSSMCSKWISLNVLSLDQERLIVEKSQLSLIKMLKGYGFKPIPCAFSNYLSFGGAFHCATLDVRRRGVLESYF